MGQNNTESWDQGNDQEEVDKSNSGSSEGRSRYARDSVDSGIGNWLNRKDAKEPKPTSNGFSRQSGLKKSRLNPVSKKQKKKNDGYKEAMVSHYSREENQKCFLCGTENNLSIHHKKKRGNLIDDE